MVEGRSNVVQHRHLNARNLFERRTKEIARTQRKNTLCTHERTATADRAQENLPHHRNHSHQGTPAQTKSIDTRFMTLQMSMLATQSWRSTVPTCNCPFYLWCGCKTNADTDVPRHDQYKRVSPLSSCFSEKKKQFMVAVTIFEVSHWPSSKHRCPNESRQEEEPLPKNKLIFS